jgi:ubiquinone/menaquinone biosynthesis C-methylase UbiE
MPNVIPEHRAAEVLPPPQHGALVNEVFNSGPGSLRWKKVYERKDVYAVIHQERQAVSLSLLDKLGLPLGAPVLEVGCGPGFMTLALAQRGYCVQAVDAAAKMASLTRKLISRSGFADRVTVSTAEFEALPFPSDSFDLLVALGVLPWLASVDRALQEIVRVLRPGAYLIANVDNPWRLSLLLDPVTRLRMFAGQALRAVGLRKGVPALTRLHSRKLFDTCLARAGLDRIDGKMVGFGPFTLAQRQLLTELTGVKLHRKLQRLADRGVPVLRATGALYLVLARKAALPASAARVANG